jgi:hypothetical protein
MAASLAIMIAQENQKQDNQEVLGRLLEGFSEPTYGGIYLAEGQPMHVFIFQCLEKQGIQNFDTIILKDESVLMVLKADLSAKMNELLQQVKIVSRRKSNLIVDGIHYNLNVRNEPDSYYNTLNIFLNLINEVIINKASLGLEITLTK